jgi:hypothetical protein
MRHRFVGPLLMAVAAGVATLLTIAPDGNGPGVTCDELYHVYQGKHLVTALRQQGFAFFLPANIDRNFAWKPGGPPVQAPLGYWILGATHYVFDPAPDDPSVISIAAARFAPAMAFALLVLIVGAWTARREGQLAGTVAAAAVALTPRLFAHAHLAALDMLTTFFFVAAVLAVMEAARGGRWWQFTLAGVVWGAAMLVRLHGLLVAPPVVLWLLWRSYTQRPTDCHPSAWKCKRTLMRFPKSLVVWLGTGVATFFVGWPWLWLAPLARLQQYVSSGTGRQALHVFYAGQVWADRDAPWHYPWVMFAVTVPLGFLVLGLIGVWSGCAAKNDEPTRPHPNPLPERDGASVLLAATMGFVLLVFSWPGTPVYDGVRLFLMVFPLWAIWVGIGARQAIERPPIAAWPAWLRYGALALFVALQGIGLIIYHPCQLSYYNSLVGGLPGAERLGFEVTYWGDSVREPMLAEAARLSQGRPILFVPNLAPFQAPAVTISSPALREAGVALVGGDSAAARGAAGCRCAVVYHRRADLADAERILERGRVVMEYEMQGVWLARLVALPAPSEPPAKAHAPLDGPTHRIRIDGLP